MPRLTAPLSKQLSRSVTATATATARAASHRMDQNAGAVLMPKYAELLRNNEHSDSSRGLTTAHRPTPQPSIANRTKPLMQTFHSSSVISRPASNLDAAILPSMEALSASKSASSEPIVPILPDNYSGLNAVADAPVSTPEVTIVAADPDRVLPSSPFFEVSGLDGVDVSFAHQPAAPAQAESEEPSGGMIKDIWRGMVEDVLGERKLA